jgi:glycosyltransferase involved in cell wall biosynthesis
LPHEKLYFEHEIKPQIDDDLIQYIGPVNDIQKNELLGKAYAFLMLIEWDEPFGIVMAEALACGTPVLGFARGAVKEVVKDGVNGIIINSLESYTEQIESKLNKIKRLDCYLSASTQFNIKHIAQEYLNI